MKRSLIAIALLFTPLLLSAQALGYNRNRIAISADGNNVDDPKDKWLRADPDDWGATPAALAMIAKAGLSDELVHFSYNNFMESSVGPDDENIMNIGVQSGIKRFRMNKKVFFDVPQSERKAIKSLAKEMAKSTADNPLYFLHMGPSEFFYQCVKECVDKGKVEALKHVYVISHSGYNDNHMRRDYHHTMEQAIEYSKGAINYTRIKDQNSKWSTTAGWNSLKDFSVWYWMRDSKDHNIQWLYERLQQHSGGVADISDAGLLYYLITGDENGNPEKFRQFLDDQIVSFPAIYPKKP